MASYDVFISYSSRNQQLAYAMCHALEQHKIKCWIAPRDVQPGNPYAREIINGIESCRIMILVFTRDADESEHVANELELAFEYKKVIIPFIAEDTPMNKEFSYYLKRKHWLTAYPDPEKAFAQLVEAVSNALGMQTQPVESAQPSKPAPVPVTKTYKLGDYYNENGKEGVVFEVDETGRHGKIVGMKQVQRQWSTNAEYKNKIFTGATAQADGMMNMQKIKRIHDWSKNYPAFAWCAKQGESWYLPAIEELKKFTLYDSIRDAVNRTLLQKNGDLLFNKGEFKRYWSSSDKDELCARSVDMYYGNTYRNYKNLNVSVRAVSAF